MHGFTALFIIVIGVAVAGPTVGFFFPPYILYTVLNLVLTLSFFSDEIKNIVVSERTTPPSADR